MFERLTERVSASAEARRARKIVSLAGRVSEDLPPGVRVEAGEKGVVLSGRGLLRRWLGDARLRGVGLLLRGE